MWFNNDYLISIYAKIFYVICAFLNTIIINRYLGVELRGEFSYFINIINISSILIGLAITSSYPYLKRSHGENIIHNILRIIHLQVFLYTIGCFVIYYYYGFSFFTYISIVSVLFQYASQLDFLAIVSDIKKRNMIMNMSVLFYLLLLLVSFLWIEKNFTIVIFLFSIYCFFRIVLYNYSFRFIYKKSSCVSISTSQIIRYSWFPMLVAFFGVLNYNLDVIILEKYVSFYEIGIYSAAVGLASIVWVIPDAFKDVLIGRLTKDDSIFQLLTGIKVNLFFSLFVILFFILFGKSAIVFFYGIEYEDSYLVTVFLLIGVIPMIFYKFINSLYLTRGKQVFSFWALFSSVALNVFLNIFLIPLFGINGAAFATIFSYFFVGILMVIVFCKDYSINFKNLFILSKNELSDLLK